MPPESRMTPVQVLDLLLAQTFQFHFDVLLVATGVACLHPETEQYGSDEDNGRRRKIEATGHVSLIISTEAPKREQDDVVVGVRTDKQQVKTSNSLAPVVAVARGTYCSKLALFTLDRETQRWYLRSGGWRVKDMRDSPCQYESSEHRWEERTRWRSVLRCYQL
jgi:hypothetical protein